MFLTRLLTTVRHWAGWSSPADLAEFHPMDKMLRILERERARADRTGGSLCLLTFTPHHAEHTRATWIFLAKILHERLRATDVAGWVDGQRVGVLLPNTTAQGAWKLADDVCLKGLDVLPPPLCKVYAYPAEAPGNGEATLEPAARQDGTERAALELEVLFVRHMPTWKRLIDLTGALVGLALLLPVFLVVAVAIKLTSPGPVFYRQRRTGRGGQPFVMYKFRTMVVDAEARKGALLHLNERDGPAFKVSHDPRVTSVGRWLRRTSLDELPQLWNVLKGDMSLVGPRPLPCAEMDACEGWHRRRLSVTPGLTCIWQVEGRSLVSFADWVRMDLQYIRSRSLRQDVKLLLLTVPAVVSQRGAC